MKVKYIVVEEFNEEIGLAHQDGEPFVTENLEGAEDLLSQLQGGYVLPLTNIIHLAKVLLDDERMNTSVEIRHEMRIILGLI